MEEGKLSEEEKAKIENDRLQKIQDEIAASGMSEQEVVQKYRSMRQDIQQFISKIGEMELELGEHELVITTLKPTDPKRVAFRLVGGVLVESTAGEVLPKVEAQFTNLTDMLKQLREVLAKKESEAAVWKTKYGIRTQQEHEEAQKAREAAQKRQQEMSGGAGSSGVLA